LAAQVVVARDGAEALDYLLPKADRIGPHVPVPAAFAVPRVVLLDLKLPKVGGLEVIRRLRAEARTQYLPIVVLTSSSEVEDIRNSYANGANAYVRKPIDFDHFLESIRCLEMFWVLFNETV